MAVFNKLQKSDPVMKACVSTIILGNNSTDDISGLGKGLMIILFGDKPDDTLSSLRHVTFSKKVATAKAFVTPEKQPPHIVCNKLSLPASVLSNHGINGDGQ